MNSAIPRDEFMRLLYEQAAREQRDLAVRVRAARGNEHHAADFERRATLLEQLARPTPSLLRQLDGPAQYRSATSPGARSRLGDATGVKIGIVPKHLA